MSFKPSIYQQKIYDWIKTGNGHAIINAVAGSGKTTTIVHAAEMIDSGSGLFLSFNTKIADELNHRLQDTRFTAINTHKVGNRALAAALGFRTKQNLAYRKWKELGLEAVQALDTPNESRYERSRAAKALASKAMVNMVDPYDFEALARLVSHHNIEGVTDALIAYMPTLFARAEEITRNTGAINFDEMVYYPAKWELPLAQYDWLFVDEAQDLNRVQQVLAYRMIAPGGRSLWVGDSRQAIYGFAGADHRSFESIKGQLDAVELPLSVNYRCPVKVLELVRDVVPHIEPSPTATPGKVTEVAEKDLQKTAQGGDMIVCRVTAPLISECIRFIQKRQAARVLGRDIGASLIALLDNTVKATRGFTYDKLVEALWRYFDVQFAKLSQNEDNASKIENLRDQVEALEVCVTDFNCDDLQCLRDEIASLFEEAKSGESYRGVTLCTVHKAKGLEAPRVFILKPDKLPLVWEGQQPWEATQEWNIRYVAITRAQQELFLVNNGNEHSIKPIPFGQDAPASIEVAEAITQPTLIPEGEVPVEPPKPIENPLEAMEAWVNAQAESGDVEAINSALIALHDLTQTMHDAKILAKQAQYRKELRWQ